ncbi:lysophosphatidylserine lipase ABHD12-like isoform X2 [Palaemon carinicauda]
MAGFFSRLRFRHRSGRRGKYYRWLRAAVIGTIVLLFVLFVIVPVVYRYSPGIQRYFIFLNKVQGNIEFGKPEDVGLPGTRNFYIETEENVSVGVWHILPEPLVHSVPDISSEEQAKWFEDTLRNNNPVIFYMHGNKGSRGQERRVNLYNVLRKMGYHIITFDYRGYGDSSSVIPSESGLVTDAKVIFQYLLNYTKASLIFVWGHSLGTGVACHSVSELCQEQKCPGGVILEAPFNSITEEVRHHPMGMIFWGLPYFDWAFVDPLKDIDVQFKSDVHITRITAPIIILHAQDDRVIPFDLGKKLYEAGLHGRSRELPPISFIEFKTEFGYGHNYISRAPELMPIIKNFIQTTQKPN